MPRLRLFPALVLFSFVVEILNPSTTFVREQPKRGRSPKSAKIERMTEAHAQGQEDAGKTATPEPDDGDYLAGSAILAPTAFSAPLPLIEPALPVPGEHASPGFFRQVQRPPARA